MNDVRDNKVVYLKIEDIIPNRFQPREIFDETGLQELSDSIKEHGVIQPIIVRELGDKYELIAGERRTKASSIAGLTTIPAIIRNMDDKEAAKVSLLENLQRKNLSAIEEAKTYKKILELDDMTQEELARTMGRSQPMVANKLRLLSLPEEVQESLMKNQISERHARSLLTLKNKKDQLSFLDRIKKERLTVRELDSELKKFKENNEEEKEESHIDEKTDERSFMNNNRGNFGGMGLNDYQGVNNNMFNNIPNNFNNIPNMNTGNNTQVNYNNFDNDINQDNNHMNEYFANMNSNNNGQINNNASSLGSMFDNYNNDQNNYQPNNNENSNLFVSHIREDNLPKVDNQFLPNFDNFNANNNFDTNNSFDNNFESMQDQDPINNFNQNNMFNDQNNFAMNNNYDQINNQVNSNNDFNNYNFNQNDGFGMNNYQNMNNQSNMMNNGFNNNMNNNYNQSMNSNYNFNDGYNNMGNSGNNYFMNDLNNSNYTNNQPNMMNNNFSNNSNMNNYNPYGSIPEYGNNTNINNNYHPNQGMMFEQPLNIIDVPKNDYQQPINNSNNMDLPTEPNININDNQNYDYENDLFAKPTAIDLKEEDNTEVGHESPIDSVNSDIEVIGENSNVQPVDNNVEQKEEVKDDYIRLDPVYTIHSTMDAVLELKKTTDLIKQNHIDIETEEIDYDDVYQITIKIKKTDDML